MIDEQAIETQENVTEGTEQVTQEENISSQESVATGDDQAKIKTFIEMAGGIPKGTEIIMHNGKPHLYGKVNGKEVVKSLEDIIRDFSMTTGAEEKLAKVKEQEKRVTEQERINQGIVKALVDNPKHFWDVLRHAGYDDDKIAEIAAARLQEAIQDAETPKEVRELKKAQQKTEELEEKVRRYEEEKQKIVQQQKVEEQYNAIKGDVYKALEDNKVFEESVPENVRTNVTYAALHWLQVAEHQGIKDFTPDKAVKKAVKDLEGWGKSYFNSLSDDMLIRSLPPKVAEIYAKAIKKPYGATDTPTANSLKAKEQPKYKTAKQAPKKKSLNDFFDKL
jgi:hypothetical protein